MHSKANGKYKNMLRKALINSLTQITVILDVTEKLPKDKAVLFYQDTHAGKHVRHVLDHLLTFIRSAENGILDYNRRHRDSVIERDWRAARVQLMTIIDALHTIPIEENDLHVLSEIDASSTVNQTFVSNAPREILYLINHTLHHAAYIRLLAKECHINLPEHIGIAPATATHLRQTSTCAP